MFYRETKQGKNQEKTLKLLVLDYKTEYQIVGIRLVHNERLEVRIVVESVGLSDGSELQPHVKTKMSTYPKWCNHGI